MNFNLHKISIFLFYLLPLSLITGPAIPDISITLICIMFVINTIYFKNYDFLKESWIKIALIFWLVLIFISFFSINKYLSFADASIFIRLLFLAIAVYIWLMKDNSILKIFLIILFFSMVFVILDCLIQFYRYDPSIGFGKDLFGYLPNDYGRMTGPFNEQVPGSHLAKFFFISILLFINFYYKNTISKIIMFFYTALAGLVIFLSGEKMALATFLLGAVIFIIIFNNYRKLFISSLIFLSVLIFTLLQVHPFYNDYKIKESKAYHLGLVIDKEVECLNNSSKKCIKTINVQPQFLEVIKNFEESVYFKIYLSAYKMWIDNPLTGVGLNNYESVCQNNLEYQTNKENYGNCSAHPHNFYLQWLTESGLIGFLLFIILIIFIFKQIILNITSNAAKISFITLTVIFWPIMSTGSLLKNWHGIETFLIIGICLAISKPQFKKIK